MKTLIALLLLVAASAFGANPAYTSFKGTSGILITSNPPTGDILISGAGVFTSSGTNATIATSTNGVLVAVASTNINFIRGSNVVLLATNSGSTTHIAIQAFTPVPFIEGAVSNYLLTYILPVLAVDTLTVSNLLASPPLSSVQFNSNGVTRGSPGFIYTNFNVGIGTPLPGATLDVTGGVRAASAMFTNTLLLNNLLEFKTFSGGQVGWSNLTAGTLSLFLTDPTDDFWGIHGQLLVGDRISANTLTVSNMPGAGSIVAIAANGQTFRTNVTGSSVAPPISSVQFNSNGVQQGSASFVFTNGLVGIGTDSPIYPLDIHAATGRQRIVSTTAANEAWLLFVNNGSGLIGLESGVAGATVLGSSEYSFLVANAYAYPVQLATDNTVRMTVLPTSGNVGIATASPTNALDVNGHTSLRSNLFLANLTSNASPVAVLATDAAGRVYETAVPSGGGSSVAAPISSVQFNSNGVQQGSSSFVFTNGQVGILTPIPGAGTALHITSTGVVGSAQVRLSRQPDDVHWDLAIDSHPETYFLGVKRVGDATPAMVWELGGNVGIGTTNPTTRFDVQGRTTLRSNVFLPNISSNASPIAFLATDAAGEVFETAAPVGEGGQPASSVLSNLVGTVGNNVTNVISLSTSNATSKPLTNSYAAGVLTLFGLEGGANVTITPNASNLVISSTGGGSVAAPISSVQFNSNGVQQGSSAFVFTNGSVGIGTMTPQATLDVSNNVGTATQPLFHAGTNNTANGLWVTTNGNVGIGIKAALSSLHVKGTSPLRLDRTGVGFFDNTISVVNSGSAADMIFGGGQASSGFLFQPLNSAGASINSLSIDRNGNVGLGTVAPASSLDVTGRIRSVSLIVSNVTASSIAAFHTDKTLTNGVTTVALLDNFFAIGISNIVSADTAGIVIRTNAGSLTLSNSAATGGGTVAAPISSVQFNSNGVQQGSSLFVFTNGMVGIGKVNPAPLPAATLDVNNIGALGLPQLRLAKSSQSSAWEFAIDTNPDTQFIGLKRETESAPTMAWEIGGNVGIGTTNPANRLDVEGAVTIGANPSGATVAPANGLRIQGQILFDADNISDIGADGANRPKDLYVAANVFAGLNGVFSNNLVLGKVTSEIQIADRMVISSLLDGVVALYNEGKTDFTRLQFGGTTDSFPALGRTNGNLVLFGGEGRFAGATNQLIIHGGLSIGPPGSAVLTNVLYASATLDFPSTAAGSVSDLIITVAGATNGNIVSLGVVSAAIAPFTGSYSSWASNDVCYVRFSNNSLVSAHDPPSSTFRVRVDKFQ